MAINRPIWIPCKGYASINYPLHPLASYACILFLWCLFINSKWLRSRVTRLGDLSPFGRLFRVCGDQFYLPKSPKFLCDFLGDFKTAQFFPFLDYNKYFSDKIAQILAKNLARFEFFNFYVRRKFLKITLRSFCS